MAQAVIDWLGRTLVNLVVLALLGNRTGPGGRSLLLFLGLCRGASKIRVPFILATKLSLRLSNIKYGRSRFRKVSMIKVSYIGYHSNIAPTWPWQSFICSWYQRHTRHLVPSLCLSLLLQIQLNTPLSRLALIVLVFISLLRTLIAGHRSIGTPQCSTYSIPETLT